MSHPFASIQGFTKVVVKSGVSHEYVLLSYYDCNYTIYIYAWLNVCTSVSVEILAFSAQML